MNPTPLADRRAAELINFRHAGRQWTLTVGRFADGRVGELFIDAEKTSPLAALASDAAVIASVALQFGSPLETLQHALRDRNTGPLAVALGLVDGICG